MSVHNYLDTGETLEDTMTKFTLNCHHSDHFYHLNFWLRYPVKAKRNRRKTKK